LKLDATPEGHLHDLIGALGTVSPDDAATRIRSSVKRPTTKSHKTTYSTHTKTTLMPVMRPARMFNVSGDSPFLQIQSDRSLRLSVRGRTLAVLPINAFCSSRAAAIATACSAARAAVGIIVAGATY